MNVESDDSTGLTVSVTIPAYTKARWELLCRAVESAEKQTYKPLEIIVCIDNNEELLSMAQERWDEYISPSGMPVIVIANDHVHDDADLDAHVKAHGARRRFGAGYARNAAARRASGDILAFLDDDAAALPDWLEKLVPVYANPAVHAVGGAPLPDYETTRPGWMPLEFDWVFGCAYKGLPTQTGPYPHLIGANMSVRAETFREIGGFHSIDFDDMDMCHRVAALGGPGSVVYAPEARVMHYVPAERVSWRYFWRRCFHVNVHKVEAYAEMGEAANLSAEVGFVARTLSKGVLTEIVAALKGDIDAFKRAGVILIGTALAAAGNFWGRVNAHQAMRKSAKSS